MRLSLCATLQFLAFSSAAAQLRPAAPSDVHRRILAAVREYMAQRRIPGASIAIGADGRVVLSQGLGYADLEQRIPVTRTTLFLIQSTQKLLTATAVLRLAETGKLHLDDPVQRYCPAFGARPWPVTLRHLLSHQGGVRPSDLQDMFNREHYSSTEAALRRFVADSLQATPGSRVAYSNAGYTLLACTIEGATSQPYDSALARLVLAPAGMPSTRPDNVFAVIPGRARYYIVRTAANTEQWRGLWTEAHLADTPIDRPANADPVDPSWAIGAGNYLGTPTDLVRFALALMDRQLLRGSYRDSSFTPAVLIATGQPTGRALGGWLLDSTAAGGPRILGSTWNGSFALAVEPRSRIAVALASNVELEQPGELVTRILEMMRSGRPESAGR